MKGGKSYVNKNSQIVDFDKIFINNNFEKFKAFRKFEIIDFSSRFRVDTELNTDAEKITFEGRIFTVCTERTGSWLGA